MPASEPSCTSIVRLHRHSLVLIVPMSLSGLILGIAGGILLKGPPPVHEPIGALVVISIVIFLLGRLLLYPFIQWRFFEIVITPDSVILHRLVGLRIEHIVFDLRGSTVRISRGLLDAFLGTGTLTITTPRDQLCFSLITPAEMLDQPMVRGR